MKLKLHLQLQLTLEFVNLITAEEVVLDVKKIKAGKSTGCDEIRPEMLKALNQRVLWLTRVC